MRVLSVFSGIGAHDLGLERAGLTIAGQVEMDAYCAEVLALRFPDAVKWSDVRDVQPTDILARCGRIDLVTGGVPCQPASVAGKRLGAADSRWLWPEYLRIVVGVQPEWVLAENVPGFLSLRESEQVLAGLEAAGYETWPLVVGAWAVGAPHKRDRAWIVGRRVAASTAERCKRIGTARGRRDGSADGGKLADATHRGQRTDGGASGSGGHAHEQGEMGLEHAAGAGLRTGWERQTRRSDERCALRWPARPGEPQHEWEAPRLVYSGRAVRGENKPERHAAGRAAIPGPDSRGDDGRPASFGPVEPRLGRATDGPARRLDSFARRNRLKALGNANPPWVPYLIGRWLLTQEVTCSA